MSGFVFTPLDSRSPAFPRVSAAEQAARDAEAERIVRAELETVDADNPQAQAALEREYELRFKKPAPGWKFTLLEGDSGEADAGGGFKFTPIETEQPSTLRNVALNNPLTAVWDAIPSSRDRRQRTERDDARANAVAREMHEAQRQPRELPAAALFDPDTGRYSLPGRAQDFVRDVGGAVADLPQNTMASLAALRAAEPGDVIASPGLREDRARAAVPRDYVLRYGLGLDSSDVESAGKSLPFSVISAGAYLPGFVAGSASAPVTGPAAPVIAHAAGMTGSGAAAYRMDRGQVWNQLYGAANERFRKATGRDMTADEFTEFARQPEIDAEVTKHATAEAGFEALGNFVFSKTFGKLLGGSVLKATARDAAEAIAEKGRLAFVKAGAINLAGELATETPTQIAQAQAETELGLRGGPAPEWTSRRDWREAFAEVALPTVMTVGAMGGAAKAISLPLDAYGAKRLSDKIGEFVARSGHTLADNDQLGTLYERARALAEQRPEDAGLADAVKRLQDEKLSRIYAGTFETKPEQGDDQAGQSPENAEQPRPEAGRLAALPETTEAEKALLAPKPITALDRVAEIERRLADPEVQDADVQALRAERDGITASWPRAVPGLTTSFSTEAGARLSGRYALMEADELTTSHDTNLRPVAAYPAELQPRERERHASEMQVQQITQKLDPARLGESADVATGAPIVGADGLVESGNARTIALKRVYQTNGQKAENYRQFLRDNATRFGLTAEDVAGMQRPVLVRQRETPVNRAEFARQANQATVARMSPSEQDMATGTQAGTWNPGTNYVPFVDQARAPVSKATSTADLPAPIRRERILKQFADALGTTVYQGRMKGEKRLGFFRRGVEEVRIRKANDIEVAAHELGHLLDARVPKIANAWRTDKALREELKSISYDQKKVSEGYAEGVRLFLTQPETLQARAPRVFQWLDDFANTNQHGPALRKAQADMTAWFEQDALNRARSKIGDPGKGGPALQQLGDWWQEQRGQLRQAIIDDLDGIYRMERELEGGKIDPLGPYESARLSRAYASIADGAVRFGYPVKNPDGSFKFAGKGLEEILKPVAGTLDDALLYFVGRSSRELMTQGREHLFTPGEVDAMLKLRTPERETAFREYQTWNRGILDFAEAQGVINPESRRMWQRAQYLPFHRVGQAGGFKGKPGDWSGIKALTGGTENIRDVLGNMVGNAAQLINKAVKNEARLKVAELAEKTPGAGKFMVKIDAETRPVKIDTQQVIDGLLKALGIDRSGYTARGEKLPKYVQKIIDGLEADLAKSPGFEFVVGGQPPAGRNVVAVLKGGKPTWYEVGDPILYRSLLAIDRPVQGWLVRLLGLPKRIGQASITLTPDFWIANIARDTLMGSVMTRSGFRPIIDSLQGMRLRLTSDPVYKDYIANGGGLSSIYLDEAALRTKLEKFYARQGIDHRTVLDAPGKLLHFIETVGDAFEMSTRLGEYRKAIARGEHPRHAAYLGREVSTDFAMMGDAPAAQFMYNTVMFLRPAVVSIDRLVRGVAHDPNKGAIAAKTAAIALTSVGLYLLNRDDPRYADLPDWDRDATWPFFIGAHHFRWPKIWEIGALASVAERSAEKLMAEDPEGLGKDFARIVGQTFNLNLMPQIVAPLYEQATNRNSFTKAPIETPGMEGVQPFLRSKPGTSETMKAAGMATRDLPEALQVNPARAEALLRGYLNTWGMYGLMLTDQAFFGDRLPEKRADELPVVRRFYSQEPARHTKFESLFYEMLTEAKRLRGTLKELDEMGRPELADRKEQNPLAGEAKPLERAAKNLGAINKEMEFVRRDQNLTPAEKRQRLDALTLERNALLKEAVLESKKAQKEKTQ